MPNQVPVHVARERNRVLRDLASKKNFAFRKSFVGGRLEVITLHTDDADSTDALSDNYLKVRLLEPAAANTWIKCEISEITGDALLAITAP
jgi:tRNA A37 methylthiotransferase MiaB